MFKRLSVCVVVPAYQECRLLPITLRTIPEFVDHIVVIDDGSTDETSAAATQVNDQRLTVLRHSRNQGVGAAIVTGYRHALSLKSDAVVVMGADAQMDPTEMHKLLEPLVQDTADYVKGDRLGHKQLAAIMPRSRRFGNFVLTFLTRLSSGYGHVRDSQCGYTAISRRTLRQIDMDALYHRYGFPNDMLAKLGEVHARVVDCPVTPIYGTERSGIHIPKVIGPILTLLVKSGVRRVWRQRRRDIHLEPNSAKRFM